MLQRFRQFMYGRYGVDKFNIVLIVTALVLSLIFRFIPIPFIFLISYIPLFWAMYRTLSRNFNKRQKENIKFLKIYNKITYGFRNYKNKVKDKSIYKYYTCKNCGQKLRVPRHKGKIEISCPKCKYNFKTRT